MASQSEIYLFYKDTCPFCKKVLNALKENQKTVHLKDVSGDPEAMDELIKKGGKRMVPCLYHDGEYLYESNDIIAWLAEHQDRLDNRA